ncbi:MAG TPA: CHASE3 domain-containing protein, partial [Bryobacteraceae bacterium]
MKLTIGQKIILGYGLALTFMAGIGVSSYRSTGHLVDNIGWLTHTYVVLGEAETILARIAEAESLGRGYALTGDAHFVEPFEGSGKLIAKSVDSLRTLTSDNPVQQKNIDLLVPLVDKRLKDLNEVVEVRRQQGLQAAVQLIQQNKGRETAEAISKRIATMEDEEHKLLSIRNVETAESTNRTIQIILYGSLVGLITVAVIGLVIHRSIVSPLAEFQGFVTAVGAGDLTQRSAREGEDELGRLARGLNQMVTGLRDVAQQTRAAIENLNSASVEILASAKQQAAGTGEQAAACQETNATIQEVSQSCLQIAEWAKQVAAAAESASKSSESGVEAVQRTKQVVEGIREQSEAVAG